METDQIMQMFKLILVFASDGTFSHVVAHFSNCFEISCKYFTYLLKIIL